MKAGVAGASSVGAAPTRALPPLSEERLVYLESYTARAVARRDRRIDKLRVAARLVDLGGPMPLLDVRRVGL